MSRKKYTIEDAIKELNRELEMRKQLYPKWIQSGKLNRNRANAQYLAMKEALSILETLRNGSQRKNPQQQKLFP